MPAALPNSPLVRRLLFVVWLVALVVVPLRAPGLDGFPWARPFFGAVLSFCLLVSHPALGAMGLAAVDVYRLLPHAGPVVQITLYCLLALACFSMAMVDALLNPWLPWKGRFSPGQFRAFMLPLALCSAIPLYFTVCDPWPSIWLAPWCLLLWVSMPRERTLARELAGALGGAVAIAAFFILPAELGARALFTATPPNPLFRPHPTRVVDLLPGAEGAFSFDNFQSPPFRAAISKQGLRDREYGPKKPGVVRVLALGDSTTFGWGVPEEDTLPRQLEAFLRETQGTEAIEVINAGTPTYGPWQCLDWLRERAAEFQPDIVMYSLFPINDPANELYRVGKQPRCYEPQAIAAMRRYERARFWPERIDAWLHRHSRFYQAAITSAGAQEHPLLRLCALLRARQGDAFPALPVPEMGLPAMEMNRAVWYPELDEAAALVMESIKGMEQYCEVRGWPFAVLVLPSNLAVSKAQYEAAALRCPFAVAPFEECREVATFLKALQEARIPVATPRDAMLFSPHPDDMHLPLDGHLSARGNRIAAQAAAALLQPLWPSAASPVSRPD